MAEQQKQFEEILIPPVLLAGLYPDSLVIIPGEAAKKQAAKKIDAAVEPVAPALKDIKIPPVVEEQAAVAKPAPMLQWLGDFSAAVLIIVNDNNNLYLAEEDLALLTKMLQAVQLSMANVAVVNVANTMPDWNTIAAALPAKKALLFGVELASIGVPIRIAEFRPYNWNDVIFLSSPSLTTLNTPGPDQNLQKKALWTALKELFA